MYKIRPSQVVSVILSVLLGFTFLLSALTKLYPIEPFEYTFVELGFANWQFTPVLARLFIGFELICGALLIFNLWLKKFTIPLVAFTLVVFSVYLGLQILEFGNKGNCGCFGEFFYFSPLQGIVKNIIMLLAAAIVYYLHRDFYFKWIKYISVLFILTALILPFILNPIDFNQAEQQLGEKLNFKLDLNILYNDSNNKSPQVELREGKWVLTYMSLTCPHCKIAAKKLHVMKLKNPELPVHMVLNGKEENLEAFFNDTRARNISWSKFSGADKFVKMAGANLPTIYWLNNSIVEHRSNYMTMQQAEVEKWLAQ